MTEEKVHYGPRLSAHATGALRSVLLVAPPSTISNARPLQGEPNAIHERAKLQLEVFEKTLRFYGCDVGVLDPAGSDPYQSAAGDLAVAFEDGMMLMRPSSLGRRPETARLEADFGQRDIPVAGHLVAPAVLNGSDALLAGGTAFVGVSRRSNALGREGFARAAKAHGFTVAEVRVSDDVPALRAVANAIASDTVVIAADRLDRAPFVAAGFKTIVLEPGEDLGAGVLCIGEHHVVADVRYSRSVNRMRKNGVVVEAIDLYDYSKIGMTPAMLAIALKRR